MIIGEWAIRINANASGVMAGCDQAANRVQQFAQQARVATSTIGSGLMGALQGLTKIDLGGASSQLGGIVSKLVGIGGAALTGGPIGLAVAFGGLAASVMAAGMAALEAINIQAKLGRQLGITATEAGGLQIIAGRAGISSDTLSEGLSKYSVQMAHLRHELSQGSGGTITNALARLNINAQEFSRLSLTDQLAQVSERTNQMIPPMERAGVFAAILGRHANASLSPMLRMGDAAEQLRNASGIATQFGVAVDPAQAAAVMATMRELKEIGFYVGAVFSSAFRTVGVMMAPVALMAGRVLKDLFKDAKPVIDIFAVWLVGGPAIAIIGGLVLALAGAFHVVRPALVAVSTGFGIIRDAGVQIGTALMPVFSAIGEVFGSLFGGMSLKNPFESWGEGIKLFASLFADAIKGIAGIVLVMVNSVAQGVRAIVTAAAMASMAMNATGAELTANQRAMVQTIVQMNSLINATSTAQQALLQQGTTTSTSQVSTPNTDPIHDADTINRITESLEKQNRMHGLSAGALKLYEAAQAGATLAELDRIQAANELADRLKLQDDVTSSVTAITQQAAMMGMSARQAEIYKLQQRGATEAMIEQVNIAHNLLDTANKRHEVEKAVLGIFNATMTPMETFQNQMMQTWELLADGAEMSAELAGRHFLSMFEQLERSFPTVDRGAPAALLEGSVEAAKAVAGARRDANRQQEDPAVRMAEMMEQAARRDELRVQRERRLLELAEQGFFEQVG